MTVASFVFSAVALALSGAAFGWQMLSWFLTGGRVKVDIRVGVIDPTTTRSFTLPLHTDVVEETKQAAAQNGMSGVVAYLVTVRNIGRTALTIQDVGFRNPTNERYGMLGGGELG